MLYQISANVLTSQEHHIGQNKDLSIDQEESSAHIGVESHHDDYVSYVSQDGMYIPSPQGLDFLMDEQFRGIPPDIFFEPDQASLMQSEFKKWDQDIDWGDTEAHSAQPPIVSKLRPGTKLRAQIIVFSQHLPSLCRSLGYLLPCHRGQSRSPTRRRRVKDQIFGTGCIAAIETAIANSGSEQSP